MNAIIYLNLLCIVIAIINMAIVLRVLKKNKERKKHDKVILDETKEIFK